MAKTPIDTSDIPEADETFFKTAKVKIPLGYTATEIEVSAPMDSVDTLVAFLEEYRGQCDDFLLDTHVFELIAETLTDGSVKRSIRVRPAEPV
jgi:hypothetical protein